MIIEKFKHKNKYIGYIEQTSNNDFVFKTGKPSDISCICWTYKTKEEAIKQALEYKKNYERI